MEGVFRERSKQNFLREVARNIYLLPFSTIAIAQLLAMSNFLQFLELQHANGIWQTMTYGPNPA